MIGIRTIQQKLSWLCLDQDPQLQWYVRQSTKKSKLQKYGLKMIKMPLLNVHVHKSTPTKDSLISTDEYFSFFFF